jgi:8-oxo-dGTP pyrophosphatase MutT (NUDIX family)
MSARRRREFARFPAAVLVFLVDEQERVLLLRKRGRDSWGVVSGALEQGETLLAGALRELTEEAGPGLIVQPIGLCHGYTVDFDDEVTGMLSLCYVVAHLAGEPVAGSDALGGELRWFSLAQVEEMEDRLIPPYRQAWIVRRAIQAYRAWRHDVVPLQAEHGPVTSLSV